MNDIKKYDYIDALRGVAVLLVIVVHTGMLFDIGLFPKIFQLIQGNGARGVQLFFILSSLTLFMSYLTRKNQEQNTKKNFFIRRFFRIAPMYYVMIVVGLFYFGLGARYWLGDASGISFVNVFSHFTFLSGLSPYYMNSILGVEWSVGVEMLFYLLIPFLATKIKSTNQALQLFLGTIIVVVPINYVLGKMTVIGNQNLWNDFLFLWLPNQLPVFVLGVILYFVIVKNDRKFNLYYLAPLIFFFLFGFKNGRFWIYTVSMFFTFCILYVWKSNTKLVVNKLFIFFGKISYSVYLVHFIILDMMLKYMKPVGMGYQNIFYFALYFMLLAALSTLVAYTTYSLIEKNGIKLGKYIIERKEKKTAEKISKQNLEIDASITPL